MMMRTAARHADDSRSGEDGFELAWFNAHEQTEFDALLRGESASAIFQLSETKQ
jgi:hypothetical protein